MLDIRRKMPLKKCMIDFKGGGLYMPSILSDLESTNFLSVYFIFCLIGVFLYVLYQYFGGSDNE